MLETHAIIAVMYGSGMMVQRWIILMDGWTFRVAKGNLMPVKNVRAWLQKDGQVMDVGMIGMDIYAKDVSMINIQK